MTAIYSKTNSAERTITLQEGILQLASLVNPGTTEQWAVVRKDADRLLRLWGVKESDPAATEMATQLLGLIDSFVADHPEVVSLVIEEKEQPPLPLPLPLPSVMVSTNTTAVAATLPFVVFNESDDEQVIAPNTKVVVIHETPASAIGAEELEEGNGDGDGDGNGDGDGDGNGDGNGDGDGDGDGNGDGDGDGDGDGVGECLASAEEEEEDNDGVEVQKISFRGRSYWLGSDQKIYACADDDEIGEEIGDYDPIEKKPLFY